MKKYAVIVAGGSGQRMNSAVPKQFLLLNGKPVLQHTIEAFATPYPDIEMVVVLPQAHLQKGEDIVSSMNLQQPYHIVSGGESRFHSVKNGLACLKEDSIVFVHDAVRCMVSVELIQHCYQQALEKGSAIPAVAATDSIRIRDSQHHSAIDRNKVQIIQTPQTFQSQFLLPAFQQPYNDSFTDEATVVEASGQPVFLIDGDYNNLKITRPIDLLIAEKMLETTTA